MANINDKNINTTSNKIKRCSRLIQYVYDKLIADNKIKRYLYYNTSNPLGSKGKGYDGSIVPQTDVSDDKMKGLLFDIPFNPEMDIKLTNSLYINIKNGSFTSSKNSIYFDVNILVPDDYCRISDGYRHFEIAQRVADIFDNIYVNEKEYVEDLGNLQPILYAMPIIRLSKSSNFIWVNMQFEVALGNGLRI